MDLVTKKQQIIDNIIRLEKYINQSSKSDMKTAKDIVGNGNAIIIYKVNGENHFAPTSFVGYINNDLTKYLAFQETEAKDNSPVITKILGNSFSNNTIEEKFKDYCTSIGAEVSDNARSYWRIRDDRKKYLDLKEPV